MRAAAARGPTGLDFRTTGLFILLLAPIPPGLASEPDRIYERAVHKPVAEILEDAEFAITERNFRITGRLHVGQGIRERDNTDFPDYEVLLFCNLGYARRMLELDPAFINHCPGRVTVRAAGGMVYIAAPLLPEPDLPDPELSELVRRINAELRAIVDYATEQWDRPQP